MLILLTGCAGFVGARTAALLLDAGHTVVGADSVNEYYDTRLKRHRLDSLTGRAGFTFAPLDIEDAAAVDALFAQHRFDAVMNLAARAGVRASIENPRAYLATNALGALNLLEAMRARGVRKFVLASTSSLYAGAPMPFVETADVTRPISPYAATKLAAEALTATWHHLHGIEAGIVRYFTVYGPAGRPDMSPFRFIESIRRGLPITVFGDGEQTRDFTYVDDIARGTIAALQTKGCEIFNLGGGNTPVTLNTMIAHIEEGLGRKAVIRREPSNNADMRDTAAEIGKARRLLRWQPEVAPAKGFAKTVAWHLANASWLDEIKL